MDNPVALAALALSVLTFVYAIFISSPKERARLSDADRKEVEKRLGTLEINHAVTDRELTRLIATVDKLAMTVHDWIKLTTGRNGNGDNGRSKR